MTSSPTYTLEQRIGTSLFARWAQSFFTNAGQFPLLNAVLDISRDGFLAFVTDVAHLIQLPSAAIQALVIAFYKPKRMWGILFSNLIGVFIYSVIDLILEGSGFFSDPIHRMYWIFSILVGVVDGIFLNSNRESIINLAILVKNIGRFGLFAGLYFILESQWDSTIAAETQLISILTDSAGHRFVVGSVLFLGLLLGISELQNYYNEQKLRHLAGSLQGLSELSFSREVVETAIQSPEKLAPHRMQVAPLFLDIRGFTAWSETQTPDAVVAMLNNFYETAEAIIERHHGAKISFRADEIMTMFTNPEQAAAAALELSQTLNDLVQPKGMGVGVGMHWGEVIRGLIGTSQTQLYDALGDTMNTASRLEKEAVAYQVIISAEFYKKVRNKFNGIPLPSVTVKGKQQPIEIYQLVTEIVKQ